MNMYKRWLCAMLAVVMAVTLSACDVRGVLDSLLGNSEDVSPDDIVEPTVNMITGLDDMNGSSDTRPVGVMVANNDFIQDEQVGISAADMWVEMETEGGITRLMAVFAGSDRVPASIGPIRSARSPFFHTAEALGLAYAHAGGSYTALDMLAASGVADLDLNTPTGGNYAWRDESYPHDYEYRLRTSGEQLTKYMNDQGYKQYPVMPWPWTFGDRSGDTAATGVSIVMSKAQTVGFTYDSEAGVYQKTNGASKTPHTDIDGGAITAANVIVLYSDKFWETDTTIDFYLQSGLGYVFSGGTMRRFNWSRDSAGFRMTENDGTTLTLNTGKTYLCVVATDYQSDIRYQ